MDVIKYKGSTTVSGLIERDVASTDSFFLHLSKQDKTSAIPFLNTDTGEFQVRLFGGEKHLNGQLAVKLTVKSSRAFVSSEGVDFTDESARKEFLGSFGVQYSAEIGEAYSRSMPESGQSYLLETLSNSTGKTLSLDQAGSFLGGLATAVLLSSDEAFSSKVNLDDQLAKYKTPSALYDDETGYFSVCSKLLNFRARVKAVAAVAPTYGATTEFLVGPENYKCLCAERPLSEARLVEAATMTSNPFLKNHERTHGGSCVHHGSGTGGLSRKGEGSAVSAP